MPRPGPLGDAGRDQRQVVVGADPRLAERPRRAPATGARVSHGSPRLSARLGRRCAPPRERPSTRGPAAPAATVRRASPRAQRLDALHRRGQPLDRGDDRDGPSRRPRSGSRSRRPGRRRPDGVLTTRSTSPARIRVDDGRLAVRARCRRCACAPPWPRRRCGAAPRRCPRWRGSRSRGRPAASPGRSSPACRGWPPRRRPRPWSAARRTPRPATWRRRCRTTASMPMTSPVERISGPEHVVDAAALDGAEPLERQHRLLDRRSAPSSGSVAAVAGRRQQPLGAQLGDRRAEHHPGGRLGQRHAGRLGHERHRARRARVGLEHVEHVGGQGELHVEQAAHADALRRSPRCDARTRSISSRPSVIGGSTQAESPEWMPASSMCSITPPR